MSYFKIYGQGKKFSIQNLYGINMPGKLPISQAILAAWRFKIPGNIRGRKGLDFVSILSLNERLNAFGIPSSFFQIQKILPGILGS